MNTSSRVGSLTDTPLTLNPLDLKLCTMDSSASSVLLAGTASVSFSMFP
ncbi:hypothetical protein [Infirmifilum lucidum]|nr:hypothetical protein [Infirmifilum lucidum]